MKTKVIPKVCFCSRHGYQFQVFEIHPFLSKDSQWARHHLVPLPKPSHTLLLYYLENPLFTLPRFDQIIDINHQKFLYFIFIVGGDRCQPQENSDISVISQASSVNMQIGRKKVIWRKAED